MADVLLPPRLKGAANTFRYVDQTGVTRGIYTGAVETTSYGGDRIGITLSSRPEGGSSSSGKARGADLRAWIASLRGRQSRVWIPDHAYLSPRGSFPTTELFLNPSFQSGVLSWAPGSDYTVTSADEVLRARRTAFTGITSVFSQSVNLTLNAPHVLRLFRRTGRGSFTAQQLGDSSDDMFSPFIVDGMTSFAWIPVSANPHVLMLFDSAANGEVPGDFADFMMASVARCALVDGGANLLKQSTAFGTSPWTLTNVTISTGQAAPDGTTNACALRENTTNSGHSVSQSSLTVPAGTLDVSLTAYVKASTRNWGYLELVESTGSTAVLAYFNASTGAFGTIFTGVNWSNVRTFVDNVGNGWWRISVVGRKTNAATNIVAAIGLANADNSSSFAGTGTNIGWFIFEAVAALSGVPTRPSHTTTTAAAQTPTVGGSMFLKGLPPSTAALLMPGDWVQVGNQLCMTQAALDSDGLGNGLWQFSPSLRFPANDNDPITVNQPMGRFVYAGSDSPSWDNVPGIFTSFSADFEEACDA